MAKTLTPLLINKLAAADRQLRAAIRLFFLEEDELAVHTVAAAAFQLIADLKKERGMDEAADFHLTAVFYVVRDYRRGTLPKHITDNRELMDWIESAAEELPIGPETNYRDIEVTLDDKTNRRFWTNRHKVPNFLKHADRDAQAHLDLAAVDNLYLLLLALSSYTDLVKGKLSNEGMVLWLYTHVEKDQLALVPEGFRPIAERLLEVPPAIRRSFCHAYIGELNGDAVASAA